MALERTFGIVKPDAVEKSAVGGVIEMIEKAGLKIVGLRMEKLSDAQARAFYAVHKERPFYPSLVAFMTSGPAIPLVLEADGAVQKLRDAIGATDPAQAAPGTVRKLYAESKERNAIHASDSDENAAREIAFFFPSSEVLATAR